MTATMPPNVKKTKVFSFVFFSFFRRLLTYYEASIEVMFFSPLLVISLSLCCMAESFSFECRTERETWRKKKSPNMRVYVKPRAWNVCFCGIALRAEVDHRTKQVWASALGIHTTTTTSTRREKEQKNDWTGPPACLASSREGFSAFIPKEEEEEWM